MSRILLLLVCVFGLTVSAGCQNNAVEGDPNFVKKKAEKPPEVEVNSEGTGATRSKDAL